MPSAAGSDSRYETSVPLLSRGLTLFVAVTSLPILALIAYLTAVENDPWWVVALAALLLFGPIFLLGRLRLHVELVDGDLRYRVRPWHLRPRVLSLEQVSSVERLYQRPTSRLTLRRVNLGRDWVDWNSEEVRYVLPGDAGVRLAWDGGKDVVLWFDEAEELARALDEARRR